MNLDELKRTAQTTDVEILAMGEAETIEYCQAARHGLQTLIAAHEALQAELAWVYELIDCNDVTLDVGDCYVKPFEGEWSVFGAGIWDSQHDTIQSALKRAVELESGT